MTMTDRVNDWFNRALDWSDRHDGIMKSVIVVMLLVVFVEAYNVIGVGAPPTPVPKITPTTHVTNPHQRLIVDPINLDFIGDSNVVRGAGVTTNVLQGGPLAPQNVNLGYLPTFIGRPGMTLNVGYWQDRIASVIPAFNPDAVFLNIGVNDSQSLDNYDGRIDAFMANFDPATPVFYPGYPVALEPVAKQVGVHAVNHAWALAALRWPNLHIVGWGALAQDHPEWMDTSDPVGSRVHYTPDGYQALIGLEIAALQGWVAAQ